MNIFSSLIDRFKNASKVDTYQMVEDRGNGFYAWDGKLYKSDIVRACIRPKTKAIGKAIAKHIRESLTKEGTQKIEVNPEPYIRFLLEEPNALMTGQMMQEKLANQLALNHNAFCLIVRDEYGYPCELYPIPCMSAEALYLRGELYLKFYYRNGKNGTFSYRDIIHIREDFNENDVFGDSPASALAQLMECVGTIDKGIIKAINNSGIIKWLLKFSTSMRPEDVQTHVKQFVENYLSIESKTFGAAGVDAKADAQRIEPKDYVPNASQTDRITSRIYAFFNTNEKIVHSNYSEDQWNAYYESQCEPTLIQMSGEFTRKLFTRRERGFGNRITFESSNLTFANNNTKLAFVSMVDRGAMTPNEWRALFNWAPVDGGDKPLLRKDTGMLKEGGKSDE